MNKEGVEMRIEDHLTKEQKQQLEKLKSPNKEKLSTKDIEELMGTRRDRYERRNGAVRRK
ncbi:hypothetical protein [Bacillus sp. OK048]|uniref:hypothetical protein n=1 Tax=Bacillus sp. OK048 TaxID=1882761 RepID=UPI0008912926|nr:hypothetical protein [Bacillus sp. OK048]SDM17674.1 hypothetical protein SAMN05443253_102178 [Bacillus sp. OK048]